MKKFIVVLVVFGFTAAAFAADTDAYTWTGAAGDGLWTTAGNWDPKATGGPQTATVIFPSGTWTITRGSDAYNWHGSIVLEEGSGTITIVGDREWKAATESVITVPAGRELCLDGPAMQIRAGFDVSGVVRIKSGTVTMPEGVMLGSTAKLIVEGGLLKSSNTFSVTNSAELVVCGGTASCTPYWKVFGSDVPGETGGCIRLVSGTFIYDKNYTATIVRDGGRFENLGGTIIWGQGDSAQQNRLDSGSGNYGQGAAFKDFLPPVGGQLIIPTSYDGSSLYFNKVDGEYDVGGSIYTTNATAQSSGCVNFYDCNVTMRGGATIYANNWRFYGKKTIDVDLFALYLGPNGYQGSTSTTTLKYRDGITFGAWADWSEANAANVNTTVEGPLAFDTKDCFDGETARSISLSKINLSDATELVARGGGSVAIADATFEDGEEFRTLEVAAGTTLELTGQAPQLKAMNLKLGANATLKVDLAKGGYVDAAAIAEFGEGAKIVVTALPAELTEKTLYPVYFAPAGTDPDLAKIEFAEGVLPSGWTLAKTANSVYLTDGLAEPYGGDTTKYWTGAGADNKFATVENWVGNTVPGSASESFYSGVYTDEINIAGARAIRDFKVLEAAGPFSFSGEAVSFAYPNSTTRTGGQPSVWNYSPFPVVVNNAVKYYTASGVNGNDIWALSFEQGSISLMGGTADSSNLRFGGDIRLGGTWDIPEVWVLPKYSKSAARANRLTVMPGATVTVSDQTNDIDVNEKGEAAFAVARNGVMTICGTGLTMSSNNTHYVDGTLTVNCPLVTSARQTFRGDGTLKLLGGVAASDTGVVRVEGNLTLVPSSWVNAVTLSVKDNVTLAPEAAWTFGDDGVLEIVNHSTLTLMAGGHKISLAKPIVTEGTVALKGAGKYEIGTAGMKIRKVTCANGAKIALADGFGSPLAFTDILRVREPDDSIAFDESLKIKMRYDPLTDETIYSARVIKQGMLILFK